MVDRTLNEWSYWQLKNINAIVWLYRGEIDKYRALLDEYKDTLASAKPFSEQIHEISEEIKALRLEAKKTVEDTQRREKKRVQEKYDAKLAKLDEKLTIAREANWLYEKFKDGIYQDVLGLCKVAYTTKSAQGENEGVSIEEKGWSLTPGAYVGVAPVEERMIEIHRELLSLQSESNLLMDTISQNLKEMGL